MDFDRGALKKLAVGFAAVTELIVISLAGFVAGYLLDKAIERTKPWLTVIFTFVGLIGGFIRLYKTYMRDLDESEK